MPCSSCILWNFLGVLHGFNPIRNVLQADAVGVDFTLLYLSPPEVMRARCV